MAARFHNRAYAGRRLAGGLRGYARRGDVIVLLNHDLIQQLGVSPAQIEQVTRRERLELERRERRYRGDRPLVDLTGKTVILVDDGLATGSTMLAAVEALRSKGPRRIVVAVPVAAAETCEAFRHVADEIVCAVTPEPFHAVGLWYEDFSETTDHEVHELLARVPAA